MSATSLSYLNTFSQFLLVVLGAVVVAREHWPKKHPWLTIGAFVLVGGLGMFASIRQGQESARENTEAQRQVAESQGKLAAANAKLSGSMDRLGMQTGEIQRVQGLNTELENKLLTQSGTLVDSSKRIAALSKLGIETSTGGSTICYMTLSAQFTPEGIMTPNFITKGTAPLYDVHVRIVDVQRAKERERRDNGLVTLESMQSTEVVLDLGNLSSTTALISYDHKIPISDSAQQEFIMWFSARNGVWTEDLHLRRIGKDWTQALRVARFDERGKPKIVFEYVPGNFPSRKPPWIIK